MSETEQPLRETPVAHACVCLLFYPKQTVLNGQVVDLPPVESKCAGMVNDPDSPFCKSCEANGHPDLIRNHGGMTPP
jgi:hypothetical protein